MSRKKFVEERILVGLCKGTITAIREVWPKDKPVSAFIRIAIDNEIGTHKAAKRLYAKGKSAE